VFYCVCLLICFWTENVSSIDSVLLTLALRLQNAEYPVNIEVEQRAFSDRQQKRLKYFMF